MSDLYTIRHKVPLWEHAGYAASLMQYGSIYVRLQCSSIMCTACACTEGICHACPTCGNTALSPKDEDVAMVCSCGTWLLVCRRRPGRPTVAGYIIPNQLYKDTVKDDSI